MLYFLRKFNKVLFSYLLILFFSECSCNVYRHLFENSRSLHYGGLPGSIFRSFREPQSLEAQVGKHIFTTFTNTPKNIVADEQPKNPEISSPTFSQPPVSPSIPIQDINSNNISRQLPDIPITLPSPPQPPLQQKLAHQERNQSTNKLSSLSNTEWHDDLMNTAQEELTSIPQSQPIGSLSFNEYPTCDVAFESTVCFFNQEHVLLPQARPYGLVGHYTFDSIQPLDTSGHRNHAIGNTLASFPMGTSGASAMFRKNHILVPHSKTFESTDYSLTFWIYLMEDDMSRKSFASVKPLSLWCPIIHKGFVEKTDKLNAESKMESKPSILIDPVSGRLKVVESTNEVEATEGEFFIGNFRLKPHRWYHIAYIRHQKTSRLYIDGIMDSTAKTKGLTRNNVMPFYIGSTPWTQSLCDVPMAIDELKIYSIAIGREIIQAEGAAALSGAEPSNFFFSCIGCSKVQAEEGCPDSFHLCTRLELAIGGYQVIEKLGLNRGGYTLFIGDTSMGIEELGGRFNPVLNTNNDLGIGFCCHDSVD